MPKLKTRKTLKKRVKITKSGKILKKQSRTGHLKVKWSADKKHRKGKRLVQHNKGHVRVIKRLLGKAGKGIK
ncbi:50S ribosomal protein L35 [bacterium]|nr:50S ribosomal protein L35 [bacterium]